MEAVWILLLLYCVVGLLGSIKPLIDSYRVDVLGKRSWYEGEK